MHASTIAGSASRQRGAAALIVVMLLFFVISLVAAYTSRNLIFEQRTAANQYRSTQALEAADAGIEWALAQLNAGRITNSCVPSTDDTATGEKSFRERYLTFNNSNGNLTPKSVTSGSGGSITPRCVFDASSTTASDWKWSCNCPQPDSASGALSGPTGTGPAPAFILLMQSVGSRPDLIQIVSNSCTRLGTDCLNFAAARGGTGDGVAAVRSLVALRGALTRPPAGAMTVLGTQLTLASGINLELRNQNVGANGVTLHSAATAANIPSSGVTLTGLPGVAPNGTVVTGDASLAPPTLGTLSTEARRFASFFGMLPTTYGRQPGLPTVDCSGGCDAGDINLAMTRNPGRPIWILGSGGTVTIDNNVGSAAAPALLIIEGDLAVVDDAIVYGLIYGRKAVWNWAVTDDLTVRGAVIAEGSLALTGSSSTTTVIYDADVLKALRVAYGTFVRVPGSWRDF